MSKTYLMIMEPLEPFAFGTERNFEFKYREGYQAEHHPYYVTTSPLPEQTTVLGSLRYLILKHNFSAMKPNFAYTDAEKGKIAQLIGKESFSFEDVGANFGTIESLSPLFLVDQQGEKWIPAPFNGLPKQETFTPMILGGSELVTSHDGMAFPPADAYNPKDGYLTGFLSLGKGKIERLSAFIEKSIQVGNHKKDGSELSNDSRFFKREIHHFVKESKCSFAAYVTLADGIKLEDTVISMGQKKFLFKVSFREEANTLEEDIKSLLFNDQAGTWYYALSDLILTVGEQDQVLTYDGFAIVEKKMIRHLKTDYQKKGYVKSISRSQKQYCLIKRGSVFYGTPPQVETCTIGYNQIVTIGKHRKEN